ncbi:MAG: threonine--tRNA ligase [Lactobacillaceae bacterium]|jgi:threonyl-tRNA synthetase|nr:threonine--tRNA ligase [Lactobacillaceae bacterium]
MVAIKLPNGDVMKFNGETSGFDIASQIGASLAKAALAINVNGKLQDLSTPITKDATITIVTAKDKEGLDLLRHSASHLMAHAVKELWPDVQVTIGPVIENGFYYDFSRREPFTVEDFAKIEAKMHELVKKDYSIVREEWNRNEAVKYFKSIGENYKAEIISDLPEGETISLYRQGDWVDLCRGPHVPSTGKIGDAFKLMKVAGAYWRGDSNNEMLQRIYATAWANKKDLDAYLNMLEEAAKRDHRKLGREMDLFHFESEYAPGAVFWHDKGYKIYRKLIEYMRNRQEQNGYIEIDTPRVMDRVLWETSGHWEKYGEHNYSGQTEDGKVFCIKPMNCPGGLLVFKQGIKSYRDLPLKMAEFGKVNRYEASGALMGLMRVREFTQDDAHIFCTLDQLEDESIKTLELILDIYKDFGFEDVKIYLSTRPEKRIGADEVWDISEKALANALTNHGYKFEINEGEGAFYGPKLEFILKDAIGREWQCGTVQVDMNLPERFDISYIGEDGEKHRPVMLHRALFGSIERFLGILIEHHAGRLPLWLAPLQVVVAPIVSEFDGYANEVAGLLRKSKISVETDLRNEKINYKIREHSLAKTPIIVVVGGKEKDSRTVTIRRIGSEKQETFALDDFLKMVTEEAKMPHA